MNDPPGDAHRDEPFDPASVRRDRARRGVMLTRHGLLSLLLGALVVACTIALGAIW